MRSQICAGELLLSCCTLCVGKHVAGAQMLPDISSSHTCLETISSCAKIIADCHRPRFALSPPLIAEPRILWQLVDGSGSAAELAGSQSSSSHIVETSVCLLHSDCAIKRLCGIGVLRLE